MHVVMHRRADPQVIQQQRECQVHRRIPEVLAVLIQPCLDKGQQRAVEEVEESLHFNCLNNTLNQMSPVRVQV